MKTMANRWIRRGSMAAAAAAAGVLAFGGTAVAETAPQANWHSSGASWKDPNDKGGVSVYEKGSKTSTGEEVMAQFIAYGENLTIWDKHYNGHPAIVKLWVGGGAPAVFYSDGDGTTKTFPLSYDEGQTVKMEVCTSDSAKAYCTTETVTGVT